MKQGIDPEVLRAIVGDDPEMAREVVEDFVPSARSGIAEIRAAVESTISERVKIASHKLKGSSFLVGAQQLGETCARLEAAGHQGDWGTIRQLLSQLYGLMSDVEASAAEFLRQGMG